MMIHLFKTLDVSLIRPDPSPTTLQLYDRTEYREIVFNLMLSLELTFLAKLIIDCEVNFLGGFVID